MTTKLLWSLGMVIAFSVSAWGQPVTKPTAFSDFQPVKDNMVSLKEYNDLRFDRLRQYVDIRLEYLIKSRDEIREAKIKALEEKVEVKFLFMEKAIQVAKTEADAHFAILNANRESLRDQTANFITKDMFNAARNERLTEWNRFKEQLDQMQGMVNKVPTRTEVEAVNASQNHELQELRDYRIKMEGMATQTAFYISTGVALMALFMAALGLILRFLKFEREHTKSE